MNVSSRPGCGSASRCTTRSRPAAQAETRGSRSCFLHSAFRIQHSPFVVHPFCALCVLCGSSSQLHFPLVPPDRWCPDRSAHVPTDRHGRYVVGRVRAGSRASRPKTSTTRQKKFAKRTQRSALALSGTMFSERKRTQSNPNNPELLRRAGHRSSGGRVGLAEG